ncbi:SpoIIE family protein phosphatase [Streptomyces sp. NPDC055952]|uniref:SpoIIE family protein phosphatase n=1 Tax=Streptomyces sp. NPDC055952 TaxID=3345663 RepID=UPI0035E1EBF8
MDTPKARTADDIEVLSVKNGKDSGDRALGEVVHQAVEDLGALVSGLYVLDGDSDDLVASVVAGAPPTVFTVPERIGRNSELLAAAVVRSGKAVFSASPGFDIRRDPLLRLIPYPRSFAGVPVNAGGETAGVLMALWSPPLVADPTSVVDRLRALASRLPPTALTSGSPVLRRKARPSPSPVIVPVFEVNTASGSEPGHLWGLPELPASAALTQMYQVHRLAESLNRAQGVDAVIAAAHQWIARPFDASTLVVALEDGARLNVAGFAGSPELAQAVHGRSPGHSAVVSHVLHTGQPTFVPDTRTLSESDPEIATDGVEALAALPITAGGRTTGCCLLGFDRVRHLAAEEQTLLLMMTVNMAVALERERRAEAEHALAHALQQKLLPRALPVWSCVTTTARYLSAPASAGMGGDWYDAVALPDGRIGLVVGDVEGHGVDSAVIMGQLRSSLRAYAAEGHDPAEVLARSSSLLAELDTELHATCCFVRLDPDFETAEIALAGHPPPVLRNRDGGVAVLEAPPNVPLAVLPNPHYAAGEAAVPAGSLLLLYTDGVAAGEEDDPVAAACALLEKTTVSETSSVEALADAIATRAAVPGRRRDDLALMLVRHEGAQQAPAQRVGRMAVARHDFRGAGKARRYVRNYAREHGMEQLADALEMITSELVTNALVHADSEVELRLRDHPDGVHLEVRDTDATPPIPTSVTSSEKDNAVAEHGRGIDIVDALSSQWGSSPNGRGKTVWVDVSK